MKTQIKHYTTMEINRDWKLKVNGILNGKKINSLYGCSGLIDIIGQELFDRFVNRAYDSWKDVCVCKVYNGVKVTFYAQ